MLREIYQRRRKLFNRYVRWEWPQQATFEKLSNKMQQEKNNKNNHENYPGFQTSVQK